MKPLQFFCYSLPLSYLIDERQLMFVRKLQQTKNPILCTIVYLPIVKYEIIGLAVKYGSNGVQCGLSIISLYGCVSSRRCSFRFVRLLSLVMQVYYLPTF